MTSTLKAEAGSFVKQESVPHLVLLRTDWYCLSACDEGTAYGHALHATAREYNPNESFCTR
jgi:hypothetical protein